MELPMIEIPIEIRYTGDLQRIQPQPGDVYVLSTEHSIDMAAGEYLREMLANALGEGVKVLILDSGMKLGVMGAMPKPTTVTVNVNAPPGCTKDAALDMGRQVASSIARANRNS